jgi:hypothetical protein
VEREVVVELAVTVDEADVVAVLRRMEPGRAGEAEPLGPVPKDHGRGAVGEERIGEDEGQLVAHLKGGAADLHRDASHDAVPRGSQKTRAELQVGERTSAAAPQEIVDR